MFYFYQITNSHLLHRPNALIWLFNLSMLLQKQTATALILLFPVKLTFICNITPSNFTPKSLYYCQWQLFTHVGPPDSKETTPIKENFVTTKAISILSREWKKTRVHPCWKNCPTWLCNIPFNNVICSTQGSERNKAGLFSILIPFLEGRRGEFHMFFVCDKVFHVELPVPCILKVSWLSFTVFKQTKIHLEINNHTLGRPQDNKWSLFLQGETHWGFGCCHQPLKHFCKSECLKKPKSKPIRKTKISGKNPVVLEIKFTDSGGMMSQARAHLCCLKMKIMLQDENNMKYEYHNPWPNHKKAQRCTQLPWAALSTTS